jgi:hypothetical protein
MTTYYNVTLASNIPHGSDILNRPCTVVFTYPDGSRSYTYNATLFAWPTQNTVRLASATINIEAAWHGANGGTLSILAGGGLAYHIVGFAKMP